MASSSIDRIVDLGFFGAVRRSTTELRVLYLRAVFGLIP